jgi:hypothetical protein
VNTAWSCCVWTHSYISPYPNYSMLNTMATNAIADRSRPELRDLQHSFAAAAHRPRFVSNTRKDSYKAEPSHPLSLRRDLTQRAQYVEFLGPSTESSEHQTYGRPPLLSQNGRFLSAC